MLVQLNISNFAIIKQLQMSLSSSLNILSGETGAGKSIIINAMNLVLGTRASTDLIRSGCAEAEVEALFTFPKNHLLTNILSEFGITFDGDLLIKRCISREGKNRIFINGSMATLNMLSRLSTSLISISAQHEHQRLLKADNHLNLLDYFGDLTDSRSKYKIIFNQFSKLKKKIYELENQIESTIKRHDLIQFQIREIDSSQLRTGEDNQLTNEKRKLEQSDELLEIVSEGYLLLYEKRDSILSILSQFSKKLSKGTRIDSQLKNIMEELNEIEARLEDISFAFRDYKRTINSDPKSLEKVLDRLDLINGLKRKFGTSIQDIIEYRNNLSSELSDLNEINEHMDKLIKEKKTLEKDLWEKGITLSKQRIKSSEKLSRAVEKELHQLNIPQALFHVHFYKSEINYRNYAEVEGKGPGPDGFDQIEFLITTNPGEDLKPLIKIASGGELSRIILALKTIMAKKASVETLIFDEVDAGISGATAEIVGKKLLDLSKFHQILCITHLPQIASQGLNHFVVRKDIIGKRAQIIISKLYQEERISEIARLLGGRKITSSAKNHAKEMLRICQE